MLTCSRSIHFCLDFHFAPCIYTVHCTWASQHTDANVLCIVVCLKTHLFHALRCVYSLLKMNRLPNEMQLKAHKCVCWSSLYHHWALKGKLKTCTFSSLPCTSAYLWFLTDYSFCMPLATVSLVAELTALVCCNTHHSLWWHCCPICTPEARNTNFHITFKAIHRT